MTRWTDAWLGRPWREGVFECVDLVIEVWRARYGTELDIPRPHVHHRERHAQWSRLATHLADPVPAAAAREGDIVHMCTAGHLTAHHLGLLVIPTAEHYVLHCARELGVCLHATATLHRLGWVLQGYYRPREGY